jgi:hypothetical protein
VGVLEVNAFRGKGPTIRVRGSTGPGTATESRDITAKARIAKSSAPDDTTCEGTITITNDETAQVAVIPVILEVGKGGDGGKVTFVIPDTICVENGGDGDIEFTALVESTGATSGSATLPKSVICP